MPPHLTSLQRIDSPDQDPANQDTAWLERRCDELAQQVLSTRDAVIGAEVELGVARARIVELEHQVHVRDVELDELRRLSSPRSNRERIVGVGAGVGTGVATGGRLARGLARRVRARI